MNCWICDKKADTGEHKIKASDIKSVFGIISQKDPVYLHTEENQNIKINSLRKAKELKFATSIWASCNNAKTAPFDKAWQALSNYLCSRDRLQTGDIIKLEKIFPGKTKKQMLNVHLFFVKLFGCAIIEQAKPIEINGFKEAILNRQAHPNVYISFGRLHINDIGVTEVETALYHQNNKVRFAVWFYRIGHISVSIMYAEQHEKRQGLKNAWHPDTVTKRIKLTEHDG